MIVGDGPQQPLVKRAVEQAGGWIHWLMSVHKNHEKALLLTISRVMLNLGMLGLGILDSFVAKVPIVTSAFGYYSPEIAYLENGNGIKGLITPHNVNACIDAVVVGLLEYEVLYINLQAGCERSAGEVTMEEMAGRFCEGITRCLEQNGVTPTPAQTA